MLAARFEFERICWMSSKSLSPGTWRISIRSQMPRMAVSRLLKSCATPPARWPTASILFCCAVSAFNGAAAPSSRTESSTAAGPSWRTELAVIVCGSSGAWAKRTVMSPDDGRDPDSRRM